MNYVQTRFYRDEYKGTDFTKCEILVVPDQSMSLAEILERFVREEPLDVGHPTFYDEDEREEDLEKIRLMDLVDRKQYIDSLKEIQSQFEEGQREAEELEKKRLWTQQMAEKNKASEAQNGGSA